MKLSPTLSLNHWATNAVWSRDATGFDRMLLKLLLLI
jgi:hypothetical protein